MTRIRAGNKTFRGFTRMSADRAIARTAKIAKIAEIVRQNLTADHADTTDQNGDRETLLRIHAGKCGSGRQNLETRRNRGTRGNARIFRPF
jgi:hypothetical protein